MKRTAQNTNKEHTHTKNRIVRKFKKETQKQLTFSFIQKV